MSISLCVSSIIHTSLTISVTDSIFYVGYGVNRSCYEDPPPGSLDQCLMLNHFQKQYTFFFYLTLCCFTTENTIMYNGTLIKFKSTVCLCDKDNCNGEMPNYITTGAPTPAPPTGGQGLVSPATVGKSSGNRMIPIQSLFTLALMVATFIITV